MMNQINQFWKWFEENEAIFRTVKPNYSESLLDVLMEELHKIDDGLYFEIGGYPNEDEIELIVTPEGIKEKGDLVKTVINSAPSIPNWKFTAFKQPSGYEFITNFEGCEFNPKKAWFLPLVSAKKPKALGLRVGIPNFMDENVDRFVSAAYIAIDTFIGEEKSIDRIHYLEVCLLPESPQELGFIEFIELDKYLDWVEEQENRT